MSSQRNRKNKRLSETLVVPNSFDRYPTRPESKPESGESFVVTRDSGASSIASKRLSSTIMRLSKDVKEPRNISVVSEDVLLTGFPDEQRTSGVDSHKESLQNTDDETL